MADPTTPAEGDFVPVATCNTPTEAHLLSGVLEAAGLHPHVADSHFLQAHSWMTPAAGGVRVLVPASQVPAAADAIAQFRAGAYELQGNEWAEAGSGPEAAGGLAAGDQSAGLQEEGPSSPPEASTGTVVQQFRLLADYNAWMNTRLYDAAATLPDEALSQERGAFFGSILGTLNHLIVADTIWLHRFASHPGGAIALQAVLDHPRPRALDEVMFSEFQALHKRRQWLDALIIDWVSGLTDAHLAQPLQYANMKGVAFRKPLPLVLLHFFNHQTHHRGQATTLLSQAGVDMGVTDLLLRVPEAPEPAHA